jgi:hypothetical protein
MLVRPRARTGVLDCSKLHSYKYNEDLFRKVTTLANGKNHGLVFVLDWSGSMTQCDVGYSQTTLQPDVVL